MTIKINWKQREHDNGYRFLLGERTIGDVLPFEDERFAVTDTFEPLREGLLQWTRQFTYRGESTAPSKLSMDFATDYEPEYYMIPSVTYNGNGWGSGLEPKGLVRDGQPWVFAWHRAAVAGATYSEGGGISVALFGEPPLDMQGFSCSLVPAAGRIIHRLIWPVAETPATYYYRDHYSEAFEVERTFVPGETFTARAFLALNAYTEPRTAWRMMLEEAWRMQQHPLQVWFEPERIWELGMAYAKNSLWAEDGDFRGFAIGRYWDGEKWVQRRHYEIGWCGQNASLANSMLVDYLNSGNEDSLHRGLAVLDNWTASGRLPNGMIHCHYDYVIGFESAEREVQDACNLGTAALNLFEAEELARRCGVERPIYRETALGICDFALSVQSPEGQIGKSWKCDGTPHDPEGTVGCFLIPPMVKAYELTGNEAYLHGAELGYRYYIRELLENGYTTAGALDTYCVDKESSIPLLKAGLALFQITGKRTYLEWAEHAAWYLATWQWHHTVGYDAGTALGDMGYDTFGGTAVSTQHHHIDPFALVFVEDWLELAELTGNRIWRDRAIAAWANATIGISDGSLTLMGKLRPEGSQDEGFLHTRWGDKFNVSQWLVAWPTAFRLEVLRRVGMEVVEEFELNLASGGEDERR
ncbi:hypothetical protein ACVNS2_19190 [Paenibacillus caseinilyticus]|uniref:Uncharacterized protein n=1 Tax=Paenibacillus mucilaginosus K02 TaxID=997761 RepID=I0BK85_9BACL|nr:hypothetical protein [Paenibacillus mucilaginosus]AFH62782.1 hypothetical protein B2K_19025 [Paenibacillus mucilaginosus K02]